MFVGMEEDDGVVQRKTRKQRSQACSAMAGPSPPHGRLWSSRRAVLPRMAPHLLQLPSTADATSGGDREQTPSWLGFGARHPRRLL
jgi:hypothetical protein